MTGATGTVGASVLAELAARGAEVVAAVRDPAAPSARALGVPVREFTFDGSPTNAQRALEGVDRVFLMRPPQIEDVRTFLFPTIDACRAVGVRQVVFLSLQGVQVNRRTPHHAVEARLREARVPFTFLRPNFFMQNLSATYAADIRVRDEIFVPAGRSLTAFIDARDIGRVAACVLTEDGHLGKAYTLSGERALGYRDVARVLTDVLGREIRYARPREDAYLDRLRADGAPAAYIEVQRMIYRIVRANVSALPNRMVRRLTGHPAITFRQFAIDHRDVWMPDGAGGILQPGPET
ncbi:uncharacterized protein YbjT (DUF2867 family) [Microbacterium sp. AK009]|nr:uncharacterized protein YbjT (DUF2867 family) [Microbacterium sp. AK009]